MARSLNTAALTAMSPGEQVMDKYGTRWVKTESGEWMSSFLTFGTSARVAEKRATQPGWLAVESRVE